MCCVLRERSRPRWNNDDLDDDNNNDDDDESLNVFAGTLGGGGQGGIAYCLCEF